MSKPNAKDPTPSGPAADGGTPSTAPAPAASGDTGNSLAVVQPTPAGASTEAPPPAPGPDDFHGHGGFYTVIAGQRQLVERTQTTPPPETQKEPQP
ncbi:hypothetical protein [Acidovorax sp. BLS4]|uniref:hypothetical protein n=1 Tax=Acidovorax sp. BLS4 TaxID=3273430 RepID=UPI002942BC45|nr:hypothetical protein [Paracidovorax avenae]WOI46971.1 hypothetical protein R1Z03_07100 [Paracidovorax avenae]